MLSFSARTSANQIQDRIDGSMEKRQRATFGPVAGCTFVVFVDDMNMPEPEVYGAQPPLELLRQVSDVGPSLATRYVFTAACGVYFCSGVITRGGTTGRNEPSVGLLTRCCWLRLLLLVEVGMSSAHAFFVTLPSSIVPPWMMTLSHIFSAQSSQTSLRTPVLSPFSLFLGPSRVLLDTSERRLRRRR